MENASTEEADFNPVEALAERGIQIDNCVSVGSVNDGPSPKHVSLVVEKLQSLYPESVILPGSQKHEQWRSKFWSLQQREALPACIFQPQNAEQVAIAVLLCRWARCKFAVKSGGHAAMKGASSGDEGITIDLKRLSSITLSEDKTIARIGSGAVWGDVYRALEKEGLAVVGGRHSDVGLGGYLLGGGISLFTSLYGWACDKVAAFEVVAASGQILNVTQDSHPDLFWALRGGGSNFGLVTHFHLETFPLGDIFAGFITYDFASQGPSVVSAFAQFAEPDIDPKAFTFMIISKENNTRILSLLAAYAEPIPSTPVFAPYRAIPSLIDGTKTTTLVEITDMLTTMLQSGHRQMYWTNTFKFDAPFIAWFIDMFFTELDAFEQAEKVGHHKPIPYFQLLTKDCVTQMQGNGGNCLPLTIEEAPYVNLVYAAEWQDSRDDAAVMRLQRGVMDKAVVEAKKREVWVEYVYMNYASEYQDVMAGFGEVNWGRLRSVAEKWDPQGVWQKLVPGYFKFKGAPRGHL